MRGLALDFVVTIVMTLAAAGTVAGQCLDFGTDGRPDIVWQHPGTAALLVTHFDPTQGLVRTESVPRPFPFGGALMAVDCFDQFDREPDLVMQDPITGGITIVRMKNATPIEEVLVVPISGFQVVAAADFDRDGSVDLVLQDPSFGISWIQYMRGTVAAWTEQLSEPQDGPWRIVATPDLDRNQHPDIVWQNTQTGEIRAAMMDGPTSQTALYTVTASSSLRVVAHGNYIGGAYSDLLLQHPRTGELSVLELLGRQVLGTTKITYPTRWRAMSLALQMNIAISGDPVPTAPLPPAPPAAPLDVSGFVTETVANRLVRLQATHSGKCLAVISRYGYPNGARLEQASCTIAPEQQFWLTRAGTIVSALGRVVQFESGYPYDGAELNTWIDAGAPGQRWTFKLAPPPYPAGLVIRNERSGLVMEVTNASTSDRAVVRQTGYVAGKHQTWKIIPAENTPATSPSGLFRMVAQNSGKCLDLPGKTLVMGTQLQQWDCNGTSAQTFWFVSRSGGHRIVTATGQVLDVSGASTANGAPIIQWEPNDEDNQRWLVLLLPGNTWGIMSTSSGKVLDVSGMSLANGAPIQQWTFLNGGNQKWRLDRVLP